MKTSLTEKIADITELPKELITGMPKLTLIGSRNLQVDGYKGLTEYSSELIRLAAKGNTKEIGGSELCITRIDSDSIYIEGNISGVVFVPNVRKRKNIN